jgi:hypothetical protein
MNCTTEDHGHLRATRRLRILDGGDGETYPYCDECTDLLLRTGTGEDVGPSGDPVVAERDRLREENAALIVLYNEKVGEADRLAQQVAADAAALEAGDMHSSAASARACLTALASKDSS